MTDKVQKIREEVERLMTELIQEKEKGFGSDVDDACVLELQNVLTYIDSLQEEPVSNDLLDTTQTITYNGEVYTRCYKDKLDAFACKYPLSVPKPSKRYAKYSDVDLTIAVIEGAKWQKEHLWKPADCDDLPEIDKEVIALESDRFCGYKVVFAHRPNPEGYNGKSIATGVVEHYTPKTYGEGDWNVPNIAYWLDIELPKEIEL